MSDPRRDARPLRIGLLGMGTVGGAVARALVERSDELATAAGGRELRLVALGVRAPDRDRGIALPPTVIRTDDLENVVEEGSIDVLVELLGGIQPAGELIRAALERGTAVVTANKALLARRGAELEACSRQTGAPLRYEAAVGGGIPVLSPLGGDLAANRWRSIAGIVNGTTNLILTSMFEEGRDYDDVLAEAQAHGYAEADPSSDVEGRDAADKLAILCRLAFGGWPAVDAIDRCRRTADGAARPGITGVRASDLAEARRQGSTIKLIAAAERRNDRVSASVLSTVVPLDSPLGRTGGVENRIELAGEPIGTIAFSGPGAGGPATSSAVLGDLIALARGQGSTWGALPAAGELQLAPGVA